MKDLPNVYVNPIDKEFDNFQRECTTKNNNRNMDKRNLSMKIKDIFASSSYIYKKKVRIIKNSETLEKVIVGRVGNYLLTFEGEKIKISDILDIELA